jgi:hypothetical protein
MMEVMEVMGGDSSFHYSRLVSTGVQSPSDTNVGNAKPAENFEPMRVWFGHEGLDEGWLAYNVIHSRLV